MRFSDYISEATQTHSYTDTGGVAGDDDFPPGNIISGMKYKRSHREAVGNLKIPTWEPVTDWKWDEFENTIGQEKEGSYHDSLQTLKTLYGDRIFKYVKPVKKDIVPGDEPKSKERLQGPGDEDEMENVKDIDKKKGKKPKEEYKVLEKINFLLKNYERKVKCI